MQDGDNPYGGPIGGQMSGTVNFDAGGAVQQAPAGGGALIKDTTTAGFRDDVIGESETQPVLVDFWAPWCGPCKQLGPIIEKVVQSFGGAVKLVKMNIDDHPAIPGQMGIQSIPAVVAFSQGKPVDGFMGALPESQVREFIDRVAGPPAKSSEEEQIEEVLAQSREALAEGDVETAARGFSAILQIDQGHVGAITGMAGCMLAAGELDRAEKLLNAIPEDSRKDPEIASVFKRLEMAREVAGLGDPVELEARLASNPADHEARLNFAKILNAKGYREAAADELFTIMRKDRQWQDEAARKALLAFFEAWGPMDPATLSARRQLSSLLFS